MTGVEHKPYQGSFIGGHPITFAKDGQRIENKYDSQGRRVEKSLYQNGQLQKRLHFIYNGYLQIAALDTTNATAPILLYTLHWDPTEPEAPRPLVLIRPEDGNQNWYEYTHTLNKNIASLTDKTGLIAAHYDYDAYGNQTEQTGPLAEENPIRYSSEYFDEELGLIYYNYRHYNPKDGRWINRDPISESGGMNLYGFAGNNPIFYFDLLGLTKKLPKELVEAIVKSGHKLHAKMKSEGFKNEYCTRICKTCSGEYKMTDIKQGSHPIDKSTASCTPQLTQSCEKGETLIGFVHTHFPGDSSEGLSQDDLDNSEIGWLRGDVELRFPGKTLIAVTWSNKENPDKIKTEIYQYSDGNDSKDFNPRGFKYTHDGTYSKNGQYQIDGKRFDVNRSPDRTPRKPTYSRRKKAATGRNR